MENVSSIGVFEAHKPILFTGNENKVIVTKTCKNDAFVSTSAKEAKSASHSIGRMFRAAAIALGITVGAASCGSDPVIDDIKPKPQEPPKTELSETQKVISQYEDAMYGARKNAATTALPKEFSYISKGQLIEKVYDYSVKDTVNANVRVINPSDGYLEGIYKEKSYLKDGKPMQDVYFPSNNEKTFEAKSWSINKGSREFTIDPADLKVVEARSGVKQLKYLPKNDSIVVTKSIQDGTERLIKIIKRL